jgi:hypothetical protein
MRSYRILAVFNLVMTFFLFISSQFVLFALNGKIIQGFGLFIDSRFSYNAIQDAPPTVTAPLPNYPLYVFLSLLVVNLLYFLVMHRRANRLHIEKV